MPNFIAFILLVSSVILVFSSAVKTVEPLVATTSPSLRLFTFSAREPTVESCNAHKILLFSGISVNCEIFRLLNVAGFDKSPIVLSFNALSILDDEVSGIKSLILISLNAFALLRSLSVFSPSLLRTAEPAVSTISFTLILSKVSCLFRSAIVYPLNFLKIDGLAAFTVIISPDFKSVYKIRG